ncbi:YdiU family protein [Alteromonas sp. ASW11-19]|uniref:Protein nucleotidyltransferase YdiU n=1 Tax=Alteromonas salexigens TaxID=2982530 RepID=A0ABT2VPB8_9ALTE|nr:YdiU family protein [Alteromonas salexigens]MCU7554738.1 YdiU family protein [Alteromonas salexigens]
MTLTHHYANTLPDLVSQVTPQPLTGLNLRLVNRAHADALALPDYWWQDDWLVKALHDSDSELAKGAVAQKYGGHQFGHWNPALGDGRGLLLGEAADATQGPQDLHLKGAGPTPYSRHADGRAVLRSTLREYLGQEALHHLGIPTSRSLCLLTSADTVYRERPEPGAMLIRTAPSHIRFGHFEFYYHSRNSQALDDLIQYTIARYFPECLAAPNPVAALLSAIVLRTARMVAHWQAHGFVHGVMNTDNMSVHGITFDYGPYAFMDAFRPNAVFNHTDHEGRYAFDRQPGIALWNLNALAHAFSGHCSTDELRDALSQFEPVFINQYRHQMTARMGLSDSADDVEIMQEFMALLSAEQHDYTLRFRQLAHADIHQSGSTLRDSFVDRVAFDAWWQRYRGAREHQATDADTLLAKNPAVIPRTHTLSALIAQAEQDDWQQVEAFIQALQTPFDTCWDEHEFARPPTEATPVSLSCSS